MLFRSRGALPELLRLLRLPTCRRPSWSAPSTTRTRSAGFVVDLRALRPAKLLMEAADLLCPTPTSAAQHAVFPRPRPRRAACVRRVRLDEPGGSPLKLGQRRDALRAALIAVPRRDRRPARVRSEKKCSRRAVPPSSGPQCRSERRAVLRGRARRCRPGST